jgi:HPr kinase/phosphorylase
LINAKEFQEDLKLECLVSSPKDAWDFRTPDLNRPGMQFCGFYEYFAFERPQVIGKVEMSYLEKKSPAERRMILEKYFSYNIPCIIICRNMDPPAELLELAEVHQVFVFRSPNVTSKFTVSAIHYLNRCLAPHIVKHGVLLDVYGVGVLLTGKSGVGKSEAALELIKRGHQLVADDVVDICRISEDRLIGTCPARIRHLMEIRGIGVIDVQAMFGIGAVSFSKSIDLIMELFSTESDESLDRIGLEDHSVEILGVPVPCQSVPIKPGRNLAIIVEVASRNLSLKKAGFSAARELISAFQEKI